MGTESAHGTRGRFLTPEPRKLERFVDQKVSNSLEVVDLVPQFSNREVNRGDHKGKHDVFFQRGCDVLHTGSPDNLALAACIGLSRGDR